MVFEIKGKVAIVTGGASGIGLEVCKRLLKNGARGVTIADINEEVGEKVTGELQKEYGSDKVIFVKTDVSNKNSFEEAFKRTLRTFKNIDILVNNAGICDDKNYVREIAINMTGAVHGMCLAIQEYITKHKSGPEGVIINTSSIAGTRVYPCVPIYAATKSAIVSLTMTFGNQVHYERSKVRVVAVAPGPTLTNINLLDISRDFCLDQGCAEILKEQEHLFKLQSVEIVGENMMKIITEKPSGTVWISEDGKDIYEYIPAIPEYKPE